MPVFVKRLIALLLCITQLGCVTSFWMRDRYSKDTIRSFTVTGDGSELVVLGDKYHYFFPSSAPLLKVLTWEGRAVLEADFDHTFSADRDKVKGTLYLSARIDRLDEVQRAFLLQAGFRESESSRTSLYKRFDLEGRRYSAAGVHVPDDIAFAQPYEVYVLEVTPPEMFAAKLLATPVTVAADGALIVGGIALVIVVATAAVLVEGGRMLK
jgi:hypothetical protein